MGTNENEYSKYSADGSFYIFTENSLILTIHLVFI